LLDAVLRLVRLLRSPAEIPVLAPLIESEILFRLMLDETSVVLHRMAQANSQHQRVATAIVWLRKSRGGSRGLESGVPILSCPSLFHVALCVPEIAFRLKVHPKFWGGTQGPRQKDGCLRRYRTLIVNQQVDSLNGYPHQVGETALGQLLCRQEFLAEDFAR
jgi:hypothetical protein